MHRTQVNKKTERHIGLLRAKLSKLKLEQEEQQSRRSGSAVGYDVKKSGDATVVLIGLAERRQVHSSQQAHQRQIEGRSLSVHDPGGRPRSHGVQRREDTGPGPARNHTGRIVGERVGEEGPRGGKERGPRTLRGGCLPARGEGAPREGAPHHRHQGRRETAERRDGADRLRRDRGYHYGQADQDGRAACQGHASRLRREQRPRRHTART